MRSLIKILFNGVLSSKNGLKHFWCKKKIRNSDVKLSPPYSIYEPNIFVDYERNKTVQSKLQNTLRTINRPFSIKTMTLTLPTNSSFTSTIFSVR